MNILFKFSAVIVECVHNFDNPVRPVTSQSTYMAKLYM